MLTIYLIVFSQHSSFPSLTGAQHGSPPSIQPNAVQPCRSNSFIKGQLDWKHREIVWKPVLCFWILGFGKIKKKVHKVTWWLCYMPCWCHNRSLHNTAVGIEGGFRGGLAGEAFSGLLMFLGVDRSVVFVVRSSHHTARRAGPGMLALFAHGEHAALNPAVVLFLPVWHWGPGGWYSLHTNSHTQRAYSVTVLSCWCRYILAIWTTKAFLNEYDCVHHVVNLIQKKSTQHFKYFTADLQPVACLRFLFALIFPTPMRTI